MSLVDYVLSHTDRGECKCGKCIDVGNKTDPTGHTADLVFFKVALKGEPDADTFRRLTAEHRGEFGECNPFDGIDHGYMELGGWIGDQGLAMQYMALGTLLGEFKLLTPRTVLGADIPDQLVSQMVGSRFLSVVAAKKPEPVEV